MQGYNVGEQCADVDNLAAQIDTNSCHECTTLYKCSRTIKNTWQVLHYNNEIIVNFQSNFQALLVFPSFKMNINFFSLKVTYRNQKSYGTPVFLIIMFYGN